MAGRVTWLAKPDLAGTVWNVYGTRCRREILAEWRKL
jgi:hypothetical protein